MHWFDAHLDLAYLAVNGRPMTGECDPSRGPSPPGCVTLGSLRDGGVRAALATIFTEADGNEPPSSYASGDAEAANRVGLAQFEVYESWARDGLASLSLTAPAADSGSPSTPNSRPEGATAPLRLGVLIEGADPILTPADLPSWASRGVVAIGLAWAKPSRYAEGNSGGGVARTPEQGGGFQDAALSDEGRELIAEMDRRGVVHDLSHLSDRAMDELLTATNKPVIASHSNCRTLLKSDSQRHLRDEVIREIGRRGGVVGINLYSPFLVPADQPERRGTIAEVVAHIQRVCELMGHRFGVGLGSDMDGGFSALKLPEGIERPADLSRLADALRSAGWPDADVEGFAHANWERFWAASGATRGTHAGS